ncbi:MAG: 30S ribosomal protein S6, partial [Nitrospirota bacterium]
FRTNEKTMGGSHVNVYENIVIYDASLADEAVEGQLERVRDIVAEAGGEVLRTDPWGRRKLAYEINKHARGNYVLLLFRAPAETVKRLEDHFKVTDAVVKYMVVKLEKKQREHALRALEAEAAQAATAQAEEAEAASPPAESAAAPETAEGQ